MARTGFFIMIYTIWCGIYSMCIPIVGYSQHRTLTSGTYNVDQDGDGISDCFDKCPHTPIEAAVNSHGCPLDTDGDGVADYIDEQLITPTACQPTDAKGVGICPEPACCIVTKTNKICDSKFGITSIYFSPNAITLLPSSKVLLENYAKKMKSNPSFKVVVEGFDNIKPSIKGLQLSWDRVWVVINYLTTTLAIDSDRFVFKYGTPLHANLVQLRDFIPGDEGPSSKPAPFPNLSKIKN